MKILPSYLRAKALDALARLDGLPPYDGPSNICRNDGYYAQSIEQTFGMSIVDLRKSVERDNG